MENRGVYHGGNQDTPGQLREYSQLMSRLKFSEYVVSQGLLSQLFSGRGSFSMIPP